MQLKALATNNGKHSAEKLGFAVADDIVDVAATANDGDAMDARRLSNQIADIATKHMQAISDRERAGIEAKGHEHLAEPLEAHPETADAMEKEILACCEASAPVTAKWFKTDGGDDNVARARKNVHDRVHYWVRVAQHMHRDWYAGHGKIGEGTELKDAPGFDPTDLVPVEPRQVDDMIIDEVFETAIGRSQSTREALVLAALRQNRGAPDSAAEDLYEEFATRVECEFLDIEHARREVSRVMTRVVGDLVAA